MKLKNTAGFSISCIQQKGQLRPWAFTFVIYSQTESPENEWIKEIMQPKTEHIKISAPTGQQQQHKAITDALNDNKMKKERKFEEKWN